MLSFHVFFHETSLLKVRFPLRIGVGCFQKIWNRVMVKQRRSVSFFFGNWAAGKWLWTKFFIWNFNIKYEITILRKPSMYFLVTIVDWNFWIIVYSRCSMNEKAWFACITVRKLFLKNFSKQNRPRGLLFFWKCIMGPAWLKNKNLEKQGSRKERTGSAFLWWIRIIGIGSWKQDVLGKKGFVIRGWKKISRRWRQRIKTVCEMDLERPN